MTVILIRTFTSPTIQNFAPHWKNGLAAQHLLALNDRYCPALTSPRLD